MSVRVSRLLALPFVVLACGLRLAKEFWLESIVWHVASVALRVLIETGLLLGTLTVPIAGYLLITRRARRRPAAWTLDLVHGRFVAPAAAYRNGLLALLGGWVAGGAVPTGPARTAGRLRLAHPGAVTTALGVASVLLLLATLALLLADRPILLLTAAGLVLISVRRTEIRWETLTTDQPLPGRRGLALRRRDADRVLLPLGGLHIDRAFLSFTIRTYLADPSRRAAIGTPDELRDLELAYMARVVTRA